MKKHLTKVLALAMAASMLLAACGNSSTPAQSGSETTTTTPSTSETTTAPSTSSGEEITDLVLGKLASAELTTFNILYTQSASNGEGLCPVWSTALDTNRAGQLIPGLASEWGTEDGGLTWTLKIREGLKWCDVNAEVTADLTAQDFATGLEWVLNHHKNDSNNTSMPSEMIKGAKEYYEYTAALSVEEARALDAEPGSKFMEMVGIEIPDATTVIYHCITEKPYFDSLLAYYGMAPLNKGLVDKLGVDGVQGMDNTSMWYCGPYIMTEYINGNSKTYEQNPYYWDTEISRFNSITHRMIESWDVGYTLYQNGEIDYVSLTEAQVKTISEDPNHEYAEYLAPDWPRAYSYQIHFNYDKMNEDGTPDLDWRKAVANENFRQSWYYGLDLTEYWKRTNTLNPMACENVCFTARNLAWTSDGKDYTTTLGEKLGLVKNGETPVRYQADKAAEYIAKAKEELTAAGVTLPVECDYYIQGSNQTALDTATVLKNIFSRCLGDDFVVLNICTYVSSSTKEVRDPQLHSIAINGWGADYNDPQNFLGQITYGDANAYYSNYWNNINKVTEETDWNKELLATFTEFTNMVHEADKITANLDDRYHAYMDAEVYALNHALVVPCNYSEGYCLSRYNIFGERATIDCAGWETNVNGYTGEEMSAAKTALLG
ncbi:MAG: hypothetical protein IJ411_04125 [Oscillospiraceae bacterium]|nr:hypothetical protein [Oscillospiraceae bacterium]